jgi:carboxylate-amine ligase
VPDYTWFWWKLRPYPRLGTVEVRAFDAQASLQDTAAIVALTHCLARHTVESEESPERYTGELGCRDQLTELPGLVRRAGGAGRQRRFYEIAGMDALLRDLTQLTAG